MTDIQNALEDLTPLSKDEMKQQMVEIGISILQQGELIESIKQEAIKTLQRV